MACTWSTNSAQARNAATNSLVGDPMSSLHSIRLQALFMAATALSVEWGVSNNTYEEYRMKSELVNLHSNIIVLADSSKFGLVASITFAPLEAGTIITDQLPDQSFRSQTEIIELGKAT